MLKLTWVNDGTYIVFPDSTDFKYWVEGRMLKYKPYQLWNLNDTLYAGSTRYIGYKYLGELVIGKDEQKVKNTILQKQREGEPIFYRPY